MYSKNTNTASMCQLEKNVSKDEFSSTWKAILKLKPKIKLENCCKKQLIASYQVLKRKYNSQYARELTFPPSNPVKSYYPRYTEEHFTSTLDKKKRKTKRKENQLHSCAVSRHTKPLPGA